MGTERLRRRVPTSVPSPRAADSAAAVAPALQARLEVGSSTDPLEHEADRVAALVVASLRGPASAQTGVGAEPLGRVRRAPNASPPAADAGSQLAGRVRRSSRGDIDGGRVDDSTEEAIRSSRGGGRPLDDPLRRSMEHAFGTDFSSVRVHTDTRSDQVAHRIRAQAFTSGTDIHFRRGQYAPEAAEGQELLAHELTHVVQQSGGHGSTVSRRIQRKLAPYDMDQARAGIVTAVAEHRADRQRLSAYVKEGAKSGDRRIANACQWILDGRTKLYALTATADSGDRIWRAGMDPAHDEAWFPAGHGGDGDLKSKVAAYNPADLDDDTNVALDEDGKSTQGWNNPGYIAVMLRGGQMSKAAVWETLVHEVQHDSDKNTVKVANAAPLVGDTQPTALTRAQQFEGFKTEYRAYSYEGGKYDQLSPTKKIKRYGFEWTERQWGIFQSVWNGYEHTQYWWDDSFTNQGDTGPGHLTAKAKYVDSSIDATWKAAIEKRREALVAYVNPDTEGFNKWDSIRVDDFYKALDEVPNGTSDPAAAEVVALDAKTRALGQADALYLLKEGADMKKKMRDHMTGAALKAIFTTLRATAA